MARDVAKTWFKRARDAESSVRIYSPYLDQLALTVLNKSTLEPAAKSVVTDLSPQSGTQDYVAQLKTLRRLVAGGVLVRSLPRLHAKMLLTDDRFVTVGSQNFTRYARESKETTVKSHADLSGTGFLDQLEAWYREATPVTLEFLDELIAAVIEPAKLAAAAQLKLTEAYEVVGATQQLRLAEELARRSRDQARRIPISHGLEQARRATRYRNAAASVFAHLRTRESTARRYWTLEVSGDGDLNRWVHVDDAGRRHERQLVRGAMYPILLNPQGRLAFVTVPTSTITFAWRGLSWGRPYMVAGIPLHLSVNFPDEVTDGKNLLVRLSQKDGERYATIAFRFDGLSATLMETEVGGDPDPWGRTHVEDSVAAIVVDERARNALLAEVFEEIRHPTNFKNDRYSIDRLFSFTWHEITLIEFLGRYVLLASEC
ncbi:hypothetical protein GL325_06025 [Aeromicrobium sp. 636]|nr:phospholipase D-like domain-containing protein [Aeromicrobium senzhongii]MCQ3997977.1 hypothetical protein [Aeromicrobium sp. 636]